MIHGLCLGKKKLTMAAPTAIPANPICTRMRKIIKDETSFCRYASDRESSHLWDWRVNDTFVSVLLPQTPAHLRDHKQYARGFCIILYECRQQIFRWWKCGLEVPEKTGVKRLARLSTDLVGAIVLGHLLSQQEHTLVPLQLLIHRLVESIADSDLTKKMGKMITPWNGGHTSSARQCIQMWLIHTKLYF